MKTLLLFTGNAHKAQELRAMLGDRVNVVMPGDAGIVDAPEETGSTFEDNALLKALYGHSRTALVTVADDSGLCVDALGGLPGVRSARFAQDHKSGSGDAANNALLLDKLATVTTRAARFVSVIAVAWEGGKATFRGELNGTIGLTPAGQGGFGYDPLFVLPDGRTLASLSADEKNAISHRSVALRAAAETILKVVDTQRAGR